MLLGILDPLEGSAVILTGAALVLIGVFVGQADRRSRFFWTATFLLIVAGVAAMFALSAGGGIGRSLWWGLLILPLSPRLELGHREPLHQIGEKNLSFSNFIKKLS